MSGAATIRRAKAWPARAALWLAAAATAPGQAGEAVDPLPAVVRSTLLWKQGDIVDLAAARAARANFVHTFPRPPKMRGLIPVPAQKDWLEKWSGQVAALHGAGIFVSASVGSTCFNPEIFRQHGLDPELYFARDEHNQPSSMLGGAYGRELMSSCYSNPHWIALLIENVLAFARSGFDGIWYDVGGYVDPVVLYCQCGHCRASWREHLAGLKRDLAVPLPTRRTTFDPKRWEDREFIRWRWGEWSKWAARVRAAVRREHPRFAFSHNMGVKEGGDRGMHMYLQSTTRLFDYVHWEEWGHGTAPYCDIPSYLFGAATGSGRQVMLVQNDKPPRNPLQHAIYLAEGYASGGIPQFGTARAAASQPFLDFIGRNEELYSKTASAADVAVLYSCWSQAFYAHPASRWPAHWMGKLLLDRHVPFDYIVAERGLSATELANYKTILVPDQAVLADEHIEALRAFLARGGNVVITGQTGRFDTEMQPRRTAIVELLSGRPADRSGRRQVGAGRLAFFADCPEEDFHRRNPRDFAKSATLPPPSPVDGEAAATLEWALGGTLPITTNAAATTVVMPRRQENRILLHLVNYNLYPDAKELRPDHDIRIAVSLPPGSAVSNVAVVSPDFADRRQLAGWKIVGHRLQLTLPELKLYSVVVIDLQSGGQSPR